VNTPNGNVNLISSLFTPSEGSFFFFTSYSQREGGRETNLKEMDGKRGKRMEVTVHDNVEPQDPHK
jgi:hypothetical protein